jgi:competence protein ComGC
MFRKRLRSWRARAITIGLLGVLVGAGVFGQAALASGSQPKAHARDAKSSSAANATANGDLHAAANQAVAALVSNGTIDQRQADAIDAQINSGSVDFAQLVSSGVVSQSQMNAVAAALAQVKLSFAQSMGGGRGSNESNGPGTGAGGSAKANGQGTETEAASDRIQAAFKQALQGLVSSGTITQHQADVINNQVDAGSIDSEQLVSSGVVSQSQMNAVDNALGQVKRSFAGQQGQP